MSRRQINEEELQVLYLSIGKGIWHLQTLEDALHTCITIKHNIKVRGSVPPEKAELLLAKNRGNTLGRSLNIAREANILSPELQKRLEIFKDQRDWLVHRSVHQNGDDLYVNEKRFALIARIREFSREALVLQTLIAEEIEDFVSSQDLSRDKILRDARENLRKLRGEKV